MENPPHTFKEINFHISYENREVKVKQWWFGACKRKKSAFFYLLCPMEVFLTSVLSKWIVYWINFQNIYTFTYQKTLLHTLLLLVFKIIESLQFILKGKKYYFADFNKFNVFINSCITCLTCSNVLIILTAHCLCFCLTYLNILIWAINFIMKTITRSFIMLKTMMENENISFANISVPFLRSCSQHTQILFSNNRTV